MKKLIAILMISTLFAQGPHKMSFQAYLTDGNNMPVAAGNYDMTFRIYDAVTDGNKIWEETQTVSVEGSMINLMLGNTVPLVPFRKAGFLEIQLQDDILSPRQEIGASMYSLRSQMAEIANTAPGYARLDTLSFYAKTSDIVANTDNQALSISGDTLYISNGNAVALDMYKNTFTDSDDQSLKISGDTLYISEGNAVALTPYKDSFTSDQASAIVANTGKTGITASQASEITANTAKTGITADQTTALNAISGTNTGDQDISGITTNATAIALNTAKTGITTDQASAIVANTGKVGVPTAYTLPSVDGSGSQVLQTDGSGAVSWATASGGSGASTVTGLSDALVEDNSLYIGNDPSSTTNTAEYNVAVGTTALDAVESGDKNVAVGYDALTSNITGERNTASGYQSLTSNTSGYRNTASGYQSLKSNTSGYRNTASGFASLYNNTTGYQNTASGYYSLFSNTTASYNTAMGYQALNDANRTVDANAYNTALGYKAGNTGTNDITTGDKNVLLGANTAASQAAASNQIVIGYGATGAADNTVQLGNTSITNVKTSGTITAGAITIPNTDGSANQVLQTDGSGTLSWATASGGSGASDVDGLSDAKSGGTDFTGSLIIGHQTTGTLSSAEYNVAVGSTALDAITEGDKNVAVGYSALTTNTTGLQNTAVGDAALYSNLGGHANTALGMNSMNQNSSGGYNVAIGHSSFGANTTGSNSVSIGYLSLASNTTSNYNVGVGYQSLWKTTGQMNTGIGTDGLLYNSTGTYNTAIGAKAGSGDISGWGNRLTTGTQNVLLGSKADVSKTDAANQVVIGYGAAGTGDNQIALGNTSITAINAQVTSITGYSDRRIKKNIVDNELGLAFINKLRTVKYNLKNPADYPEAILEERYKTGTDTRPVDDPTVYDGLIAQEVKVVLDELGVEWSGWSQNDSNGKQGLQYGALTVPLIKAIQEQQAQIEALQNQVRVLVAIQTQGANTSGVIEGDE